MNILITGATGLLGKALSRTMLASGHQVIGLSRRKDANGNFWNAATGEISLTSDIQLDAVIHLAGENVADGRWSGAKKDRIMQSRVQGSALIARYVSELEVKPKVVISASGIGYYGETGDAIVDESSPSGDLYISEVCRNWEQAMAPASEAGIRVVHARLGMVLSRDGGALVKMLPAFKMGLGGVVGPGRQWMSWVGLNDVVRIFEKALDDSTMDGVVNVVAPNPVTNEEFTRALGRVLRRPTVIPMPSFLVKLIFGQMGEELLLASCRVEPKKLIQAGCEYEFSELKQVLASVIRINA